MNFTWDEHVLPALKRAVALKGEDYVYEKPTHEDGLLFCSNWTMENGVKVPSCIVGHVLFDLLPNAQVAVRQHTPSDDELLYQRGAYGNTFDNKSWEALRKAQNLQDSGNTWGIALEQAIVRANLTD